MQITRSTYRTLLRLVDKHITNVNNSPLWRKYVQSQFRAHRDAQPEQAAALLHTAQLYAKFLHDVQYHKVCTQVITDRHRQSSQLGPAGLVQHKRRRAKAQA